MTSKAAKPFLKWAGGKTQLIKDISKHLPFVNRSRYNTYVEPFVGSGAVLFWIIENMPQIKRFVINDLNGDLVNTYKVIKEEPSPLIEILETLQAEFYALNNDKELKTQHYLLQRNRFNGKEEGNIVNAALFIYLNKTCFNGLYRVNKSNKFNVPIGSYTNPLICDKQNLLAVSKALKPVELLNGDFTKTLDYANEHSIFYIDPPYKPLSTTSNFNSYAAQTFDDSEQIRLKKFCDDLGAENAIWILSNSDVKGVNDNDLFFDELYKSYNINRIQATRRINSNADKRGMISELLITNSSNPAFNETLF